MATSRAPSPSRSTCARCSRQRASKLRAFICFALIVLSALDVFGQAFPAGPVTIVVPLAPGDAADVSSRSMAEEMSRKLGVPVLAVNRPGAGGAVGAASVAQAKKD